MFGWLKRKKPVAPPVKMDFKTLKAGLGGLSKKAMVRLIVKMAVENHRLTMLVAQKKIVIKGEPKTRKQIDRTDSVE